MLEEEFHSTVRRAHKKVSESKGRTNRASASRFACNDDIASSMYGSVHGQTKMTRENRSKHLRQQFKKNRPSGSVEYEPIKEGTQVKVDYMKSKNFELAPYARKITSSRQPVYETSVENESKEDGFK